MFVPDSPGTFVPRKQIEAMTGGGSSPRIEVSPPEVTVSPKIVNVFDEQMAVDALGSDQGQKAILNVIRRNKDQVQTYLR